MFGPLGWRWSVIFLRAAVQMIEWREDMWSSFQMPVSSNDMIVLAKLSDWLIGSISTNGKLNQTNSISCKRKFSCPLSMFQVISRNSEWFIAMFALVAIGRNSFYVVEFSIVFWKALWNLKSVNVDRSGKLNKKNQNSKLQILAVCVLRKKCAANRVCSRFMIIISSFVVCILTYMS